VLDVFCGEHAEALGGVVDAVARVRDVAQRALVVLGLEAEVALAHDDDDGHAECRDRAQARYVPLDERELLGGLCDPTRQNGQVNKQARNNLTFTLGEGVDADDLPKERARGMSGHT